MENTKNNQAAKAVKCEHCKSLPHIVKHCFDSGQVYYNMQCLCKKTALVRGTMAETEAENEWENKWFNTEPQVVNDKAGWTSNKGRFNEEFHYYT